VLRWEDSKIAANALAEPKKEKEVEPWHEPVQIEMTEQAAILKGTAKKEHTGA
jgi:hypothetical protein